MNILNGIGSSDSSDDEDFQCSTNGNATQDPFNLDHF